MSFQDPIELHADLGPALNVSNADAVAQLYSSILKRSADDGGLNSWVSAVNGGVTLAEVRAALINSAEASATIDPLVRLYEAAFGRVPEDAGLEGWATALRSGTTFLEIAQGFTGSPEFAARYPEVANGDLSGFITALYQQTLGRAPEAAGLAGWIGSGLTTAEILIGFSESLEFHNRSEANVTTYLSAVGQGNTPNAVYSLFQLGTSAELTGDVIDGKVAGATIGIDVNGDGIIGDDEPTLTTDALGNFSFPDGTPTGNLIATGGTDISTGLPFTGKLEAPSGSTVITPLTTIIKKLADLDTDATKTDEQKAADAQVQLKALLGLTSIGADITKVDFVTEASEGDVSGTDGLSDLEATQLYAASVQLLNIVAQGSAAITGADGSISDEAASDAVFAALAAALNSQPAGTQVDLSSSTATDNDDTNDADDFLTNVIKDAAGNVLTGDALANALEIADSAAKIAASANKEVADILNALEALDPLDPNFGDNRTDTIIKIVQTQKVVQGEAADDLKTAAGSTDPNAAADGLADTVGSDDGSGFNDESIITSQNIGDITGDGTDDDGTDGTDNADNGGVISPDDGGTDGGGTGGGGGGVTVAFLDQSTNTVTLNNVSATVTFTTDGTRGIFTTAGGGNTSFALADFDKIALGGQALEMSGATVDQLFPDFDAGQIDINGFAGGGTFNISDVDFGDIRSQNLQSPNVWLSNQNATDPVIAGFTFSETGGQNSILPNGLTVNRSLEDTYKAWWDSFDDFYAGGSNYYNTLINTQFVHLGNDYAAYLNAGGQAFLDVVKTSGDYSNRQQTLHDNLLGNLGDAVIVSRFGADPGDDPRTDTGRDFGDRPLPSGNDNTLVRFEEAKTWDAANGVTRSDSNIDIKIGSLDDIAEDDASLGDMWNGTGNSIDNFRIVQVENFEIELGIKAKVRKGGDFTDGDRKDLLNETFYNDIAADGAIGAPSSWNRAGTGAPEDMARWSFDFSIATNIDGTDADAPLLSDFLFKLVFDVDPGVGTSFVTYTLDQANSSNWLFESAESAAVAADVIAITEAVGGAGSRVIISDNAGENNAGNSLYVAQNSQNFGFVNTFERFVNTFLGNTYEADGSKSGGTNYWEAEADAGQLVIGLQAYSSDGATLLGQNTIVVDSVVVGP